MFCLFKFFFLYSKNFNFYFHNFFFIKNFNNLFYFNFELKNVINLEKNYNYKFKKNNFLFFFKSSSFLFNFKYSLNVNREYINDVIKFNKVNFYKLNNVSFKIYKKFLSAFYFSSINNFNFVVLDDNYKNLLPLYNYVYSEKNLMTYKKYFFVNKNYFTNYNWIYFYKSFIIKFNISFVMVLNYYTYKYFYNYLLKINLPIASLIPIDCHSEFADYPLFFYNYEFDKFLFLNLLTNVYLSAFNYNTYNLKKKYIYIFYNFQNINKNYNKNAVL